MATLPHWGNGRFNRVDSPSNGEYGWYACEFNCPWVPYLNEKIPKLEELDICFGIERDKLKVFKSRIIYPSGNRTEIVTKVEYDFMKRHNFPCRFIVGWEWHKNKDKYISPFAWMPKVYKRRKEIVKTDKTGMLQYALKTLLNGLYGKTAQSKKGAGRLTNFFYASYITAETRLKVAEVAIRNKHNVIEIATDSVTLNRPIYDLPISGDLGDWGVDEYVEGLFIGSGMRQEWRKLGGEYVTYARGLTNKRDFDMKAFLHKNRESSEAWFTRKRPIHMGEMLIHHKALKFEDLGVFTDVRKRLNVNTDTKSQWERDYDSFGDFLESRPMKGKPLEVVLEC